MITKTRKSKYLKVLSAYNHNKIDYMNKITDQYYKWYDDILVTICVFKSRIVNICIGDDKGIFYSHNSNKLHRKRIKRFVSDAIQLAYVKVSYIKYMRSRGYAIDYVYRL